MARYNHQPEPAARAEVYGLRPAEGGRYFYVGVTRYLAAERFATHLYEALNFRHANRRLGEKVRAMGAQGVTMDVLGRPLLEDRWTCERDWILRLLEEGHPLLNRIHVDVSLPLDLTDPDTACQVLEERLPRLEALVARKPGPDATELQRRIHELGEAVLRTVRSYRPEGVGLG